MKFYESDAFNESEGNEGRAFVFTPDDRRQLAKLLRVMSTLENIRSAIVYTGGGRIDLAKIDIGEAITALTASRTSLDGVAKLSQARNWLQRDTSKAIAWLNLAHGSIVK